MFRHLPAARDLAVDEHPRHEVCVEGFWISKYETRNADWRRIMGPKTGTGAADLPVSGVTWSQARTFAERLGAGSGSKFSFRLPTEAEWEYACRGGEAEESVPTGREASDRAWYNKNEDGTAAPRPVGKLAANAFGLHDMLGNVWEWVDDGYVADAYARHDLFDPRVGESAAGRVIRGGSHRSEPMHMRCANRGRYAADESLPTLGFRLVRSK
jgi:formylglycine-generating enzyme required for sulfatase activity